jgi:hypothetical protein
MARRALETSQRSAFDASLLSVKQAQQQLSAGASGGAGMPEPSADLLLQMSRRLAVFYRPHTSIPVPGTAFTATNVSMARDDRLRLKALMGLLLHLVRRPEQLQQWVAMWGQVSSAGIPVPTEASKRPTSQVEVLRMVAPMKALFAILVRTANASLISLNQLPSAAPAIDIRTELLLPLQVLQILVNTAKSNPDAHRPLSLALGGVNEAVLQLFSTLSELTPKAEYESTYLAIANSVAFYLNQLVEMSLNLSQVVAKY